MEGAQESAEIADEIAALYDHIQAGEADKEDPEAVEPEAPEEPGSEPVEAADSDETPEEPEAEPDEDERLEPYHHWKAEYKEAFSNMSRAQQDAWLAREREFDSGIRQKAEELNRYKSFQEQFVGVINPLVQGWQMKGMTPAQGISRLVAMEQQLRENPQETLLGLAKEYGVNLESAFQDAPYVDPQIADLQTQLRELQEQRNSWQLQQQQNAQQQAEMQRQQALQAFEQFSQVTDENGQLAYPYATDDLFIERMAAALSTGRASTLEQAYSLVLDSLKSHPFFQSQLQQTVKQTAQTSKAKVDKARKASKAVDSKETADSQSQRSLTEEIESHLEAAGIYE